VFGIDARGNGSYGTGGPARSKYEDGLAAFARRHDFRMRDASSGLRAIAPDGAFEIVLDFIPTAEASYRFVVSAPIERPWLQRAWSRISRVFLRRRPRPSFEVWERPLHIPFSQPFTEDEAFDAAFLVRPETAELRRWLHPELRATLLELAPSWVRVGEGALTLPLAHEGSADAATEAADLRAVSRLVAHVTQLGAEGADATG
jgi:hypothetical protein